MTTTDENPRPAAETDLGEDKQDYLRILDAIQTGALRLLAGFPQQPSGFRIQVGEVTVEAQWPEATRVVTAPTTNIAEPEQASAPAPTAPAIRAPSVGVFYRSREPGADPFVELGDRVTAGQQVAIVEAMKLMIPVTAAVGGVISEILVNDCDPVQFDDPLFSYTPD